MVMLKNGINLRQASKECGLCYDVLKKFTADLPILCRYNGGDLYDRKALFKKINAYKSVPNEPPEGCDHLANIAIMLGMSKTTLYVLERNRTIKPIGVYRAAGNGRLIKFYNVDVVANLVQKTIDKKALFKKPSDFSLYGQLDKVTISQLKTITHALNLARA